MQFVAHNMAEVELDSASATVVRNFPRYCKLHHVGPQLFQLFAPYRNDLKTEKKDYM